MHVPLVADSLRSISRDYGVLKEDEGIAYRYGWTILIEPIFFFIFLQLDLLLIIECDYQ